MVIDEAVIKKISQRHGEAFYILNTEQFKKNYLELKKTFSDKYSNFNIAYSYKTNYIPRLCSIVNELGGYAETVSEMEVELALKCGVKPDKIIWNGPIKEPNAIEKYLKIGVLVNVDTLSEVEAIKAIAAQTNQRLNVGIRCNYDVEDGVVSRFGFDINSDDFYRALNIITTTPNIKFINFQCHFAKRQLDYWPNRVRGMLELIDKVGIIPDRIDLGGGMFGKMDDTLKSQFADEIPTYDDYANVVAGEFADHFATKNKTPELVLEPGSALVGDCMSFVGTVKTIKNVRGKYFATVLGSQKNISMSGVNPPIKVIHIGEETSDFDDLDFVGFTCIEGDVLYKNYRGSLAVGDKLVIGNCGSYSIVMKPPFILPNFPILEINENEIKEIKKAECFDDVFRTYEF